MFDPSDPYTQTWDKTYGKTTCSDWNYKMTREQRFAAAADMLTAARNGDGLPFADDSVFLEFGQAISEGCFPPVAVVKITEVAAALYALSDDFKG